MKIQFASRLTLKEQLVIKNCYWEINRREFRDSFYGVILRKEEDALVEMEFNHKTKKVRRTTLVLWFKVITSKYRISLESRLPSMSPSGKMRDVVEGGNMWNLTFRRKVICMVGESYLGVETAAAVAVLYVADSDILVHTASVMAGLLMIDTVGIIVGGKHI
ncbi:calmodulin-binding transcription activator 5 [Actinidia rufa]|uniref:Calmodulin-binding transcription activator 5 n=1 Tax=Actinidia rufa TaxID=165716 RepID=A0A7J0GLD9_9ERIC|nr:calmodulin-binding transcription activator 5 [Actinidia rufa]